MKNFYFFSFLLFLMLINHINSDKDIYDTCNEGEFGRNCEQNCTCDLWSSNKHCSKMEGRCLGCHFGHFGKECLDICRPECKTNLCCAVKDKNFKKSKRKIEFDASVIKVKIGNYVLNISADYNTGYPLTVFNNSLPLNDLANITDKISKNYSGVVQYIYKYSNYTIDKGAIFNNIEIDIGNEKSLKLNLPIIFSKIDEVKEQNINGVIGLGFLNSINFQLFDEKKISLNIASYEIKNEKVSIIFGDLFGNEKKYVHKLSYCETLHEDNSNSTFLRCLVKGMKRKTDSDALQLNNIEIQFSLNQNSSFILNDIDNYTNYIIKYFFNNKNYEKNNYQDENNHTINYYCFKSSKINKLTDFGFVINKYYYSYKADKFFVESPKCKKGYYQFIIQFSNDTVGLTFGNNFFKDTQITIDNEERIIYFYTKHAEYFSGDLIQQFKSEPDLVRNPFVSSLICIGIILLLNVLSFFIYFYFKRKKEKIN